MPDKSDQPKILVDEDWKSQVQAEKEAAKEGTATPAPADRSKLPVESDDLLDADLPPPSLAFLLTTLATQAMMALGQVPNPITGKAELRPKQAKHYIDTLGMLEEKTAGNRTAEESVLITDVLHQLRMAYVVLSAS